MEDSVRVLLLQDAEVDAALIREALSQAEPSFTFQTVRTPAALDEALAAFGPALVLSDYALENLDGLSALAAVRKKDPDLPFIFVSWEIHEASLLDAMKKGATDYVFKHEPSRLPLAVFRALKEAAERRELKVTHQKASEEERLKALGQMASGIAHDFSNALTPVLGFSEILLHHPEFLDDRPTAAEYLQIMNTAAKDAMSIVGRLREFYRKRETEAMTTLDLRQVVEQAVLLTRPKWKNQALAKGAVIRVETELTELPKISGNDSALREVLTNLIFNAVDAMPRGGTIRLAAREEGGRVKLEIADTGMGMTEEVRRHCFDPFFSTKGKAGTGLGLSMVYGMIKRHHGRIDVESAAGKGTCFTIWLPARPNAALNGGGPNLPGRAKQRTLDVLVVDDEPLVRHTVENYFTSDGHRVVQAADADECLEKFKRGAFDLVVTDWAMPGMPFEEMVLGIRSAAPRARIILLTGFDEPLKETSRHPAVDCILAKPATLLSIREAVAKIIYI